VIEAARWTARRADRQPLRAGRAGLHRHHGHQPYDVEKAKKLLAEAGVKTPLELDLVLPPPPYARQGGELIAAQLAKVGIVAKIQNVEWAQWMSGTYGNKNYDLSLILHVEPFDLVNYTKPEYYWGYQSARFNEAFDKARNAPARGRPGALPRRCAAAAGRGRGQRVPVPAAVHHRGGAQPARLWKDLPIFVNDIAALYWAYETAR
jgi:peptide/nickel transport system substrate-binding protein